MRRKGRSTGKTVITADAFLSEYPDPVRELSERLRRLALRTVPTASEHVYTGWRALGYRDPQSGYFCGIFPQSDHVRLLFEHGAALPDPDGILSGTTSQVRYVEIREPGDIRVGAIQRLLRTALVHGAV